MRQRAEHHSRVEKALRTKRENSADILDQSHHSTGFVEAMHGHMQGTRTMLPDTNRDEHKHTAFSNFTCHSIFDSLRWICALKTHNATRRQNRIPIFARNLHMSSTCMFRDSVFALIPDLQVRATKLTNRWISGCWRRRIV